MFEKEAEENGFGLGCTVNPTKAWQKGAEFGYNKAKEEDKWHYPSKGEYPKDEKEVLVYMWGSFYIGSYKQDTDDNNNWHFNDFDEESEQVTAWKEIVPPKQKLPRACATCKSKDTCSAFLPLGRCELGYEED